MALRTLSVVMRQYANENKEMLYPPCRLEQGVFQPDWTALRKGISNAETLRKLDDLLAKGFERPICYTGYLLVSDAYGLPFLANLDKAQSVGMQQDFALDDPAGLTLRRMREGIERYLAGILSSCAGSGYLQSQIPLFWEMPPENDDVARVLYLDGHIEYLRYPSSFPVTPLFAERLRSMACSSGQYPVYTDVEKTALKVAHCYTSGDLGAWGLDIRHCDSTPSVKVGDAFGYRVDLSGRAISERVSTLILVPALTSTPPAFSTGALERAINSNNPADSRVFLGTGTGFHWFGFLAYPEAQVINDAFLLNPGLDLYASASRYYRFLHAPEPNGRHKAQETTERPQSIVAYTSAYFHCAEGKDPVCTDIIQAACILRGAKNRTLFSVNPIAAPEICQKAEKHLLETTSYRNLQAVAGVFLTVLDDRGRSGEDIFIDPQGVELLRQMPPDAVRNVLHYLIDHLTPGRNPGEPVPSEYAIKYCEAQKAACRELLRQLGQS